MGVVVFTEKLQIPVKGSSYIICIFRNYCLRHYSHIVITLNGPSLCLYLKTKSMTLTADKGKKNVQRQWKYLQIINCKRS